MLIKSLPPRFHAMLLAFIGFSSFAVGDAAYKYLAGFYPVAVSAFYGAFLAFIILLIFQKPLGGVKNLFKSPDIKWHVLRGFCLSLQFLFLVLAMKALSMTDVYTIIFTAPFFVLILSGIIFRDAIPLYCIILTLCGFAGVLIALQPQQTNLETAHLFALASAFLQAVANVVARKITAADNTPLSFMIYAPPCVMIIAFVLNGGSMTTMIDISHSVFFIIAAATSCVGMYAVGRAFAIGPSHVAAPMVYIQLLWGIVLSFVIFADAIHLHAILGAACVIAAGCALLWYEQRSSKI